MGAVKEKWLNNYPEDAFDEYSEVLTDETIQEMGNYYEEEEIKRLTSVQKVL